MTGYSNLEHGRRAIITALFSLLLLLGLSSRALAANEDLKHNFDDVSVMSGDANPINIFLLYPWVDPTGKIPRPLLKAALTYYHQHLLTLHNPFALTVVDFSKVSSSARFYIINMKTGLVGSLHVAHGKGSDPQSTGFAQIFGNGVGSDRSSLGFYMTAETYSGKHGLSLRIDGLSSTNSNVREREVVVHGAEYVHDADVKTGRSDGCFALPMADHARVINFIKEGSLIFAGRSAVDEESEFAAANEE